MEKISGVITNQVDGVKKTEKLVSTLKVSTNSLLDLKDPKDIYESLKLQDNPPFATKEQIIWLYNEAVLHEVFLSYRKWPIFAEAFNLAKGNIKKFGFKMPLCYYTIINLLGGDYNVSTTKKYVLELLNK